MREGGREYKTRWWVEEVDEDEEIGDVRISPGKKQRRSGSGLNMEMEWSHAAEKRLSNHKRNTDAITCEGIGLVGEREGVQGTQAEGG
jgi:hypothetical protein